MLWLWEIVTTTHIFFAMTKAVAVPNDGLFPSKARTVYKCAGCGKHYPATMSVNKKPKRMICVDHIEPAGSFKDFSDAEDFMRNLYCKQENLQVLCDYPKMLFDEMGKPSCHYIKTQEERKRNKNK